MTLTQNTQDRLIEDCVFSFVDVETTGLSPAGGARICEIALIKRNNGKDLGTFNQLIHPGCAILPTVSAIHGITDEMVKDSPSFRQIAPKLVSLLSDTVVVCHNADFDVPFLAYELARAGLRFPSVSILDTLKFARRHGNFPSNRLGNIAKELGFSNDGWHRALNDVLMTEKVFYHFIEKFQKQGVKTVKELVSLQC
jgi:DNA polymerase III epsilon subunit family exonuclease